MRPNPNKVLVIQEFDHHENATVIGVAKDWDSAIKIIKDYYGKDASYSPIEDIRDSGIEFTMDVTLNPKDFDEEINHICVQSFIINKL